MKFISSFIAIATLAVFVEAANLHDGISRNARHSKISRRGATSGSNGRCKPRPSSSSAPAPVPSSTPASNNTTNSGGGGAINGLLNVKSNCGSIGAIKESTKDAGPNGSLAWLNCGINDGGWNPQYLTVDDIITTDLNWAVAQDGSPFKACKDYIWAFEQYGQQYGIPPIILASFAMQESTCNPETIGGAGEQGLMQLTNDKCGGAPNGKCRDVNYNVMTAASYFSGSLAALGGDLLQAVAHYNGWRKGMTYSDATAARWTSCCHCQNNLDYLHQFFNGWILNIDAYSHGLGIYFNLNACS